MSDKINPDDPCPCGNWGLYKHCCGKHGPIVAAQKTDPLSVKNLKEQFSEYYEIKNKIKSFISGKVNQNLPKVDEKIFYSKQPSSGNTSSIDIKLWPISPNTSDISSSEVFEFLTKVKTAENNYLAASHLKRALHSMAIAYSNEKDITKQDDNPSMEAMFSTFAIEPLFARGCELAKIGKLVVAKQWLEYGLSEIENIHNKM